MIPPLENVILVIRSIECQWSEIVFVGCVASSLYTVSAIILPSSGHANIQRRHPKICADADTHSKDNWYPRTI